MNTRDRLEAVCTSHAQPVHTRESLQIIRKAIQHGVECWLPAGRLKVSAEDVGGLGSAIADWIA